MSRRNRCPACCHPDWCMFGGDGRFLFCQRVEVWNGQRAIRHTAAGWMFVLEGDARQASPPRAHPSPVRRSPPRATLDKVYRSLAELCGLDEHGHEDVVLRREFPSALETGLYFSLPRARTTNETISEALIAAFGVDVTSRTPGFMVTCRACDGRGKTGSAPCRPCDGLGRTRPRFQSVRGNRHDYAAIGIDENGLAFWGTVRRLPFDPTRDQSKYRLLSSSRGRDASLAGLPKYHVAGRQYPTGEVWLTEGVVKAELTAGRRTRRVIGLYSTSVDDATLAEVVRLGREWGAERFVVAFDADKHITDSDGNSLRPAVLAGERKLIEALLPIADVYSAEWSLEAGKGIDDLLAAGGTYRLLDRYVRPTPRPRVPRICAAPGPVDEGEELPVVQRETAERIARRFQPGYANTVALIAPPPGTAKTGSVLRALGGSRRNAALGVARHLQADELVARSREELCRCGTKRGGCEDHSIMLNHDEGRNAENCLKWDVVEAAREAGYGERVGLSICGTQAKPLCEYFFQCWYQVQYDRGDSHVAPAEVVTQRPRFTENMSVVVFDDLDSGRLVTQRAVTEAMLERAKKSLGAKQLLQLIEVLDRALQHATREGAYHRAAYDLLDDAARIRGTSLEAVLAATPPAPKLTPPPTVEGYRTAMPGQILDLVQLLHEEYGSVRGGTPFTSGLRITPGGIDIARLLAPTMRPDGVTSLTGKAVLVLSSTPDPILRQWMGTLGLKVLREYQPRIALPDAVRVVQDVAGFYGKGTTQSNSIEALIERATGYLSELHPSRPAVITHKHLQGVVAEGLSLPIERVLYFGNSRGSNALRDADCLLVIGTPGMDPTDAYRLACAAYRGEGEPPSRRMEMTFQPYGGWRDARGRGGEIEVLSFVDRRVAEIHESSRRDEIIQAIYGCRPFDLGKPQDDRPGLTVVLLSAMPIDGLRVDELRFRGNAARAEGATLRLQAAFDELTDQGTHPSSRALAGAAHTDVQRAQAFLRTVSAARSPTCIDPLIQVGDQAAETSDQPSTALPIASGCTCRACPANRGDKCNCGRFWFVPPTGLDRVAHCGVHDPRPSQVELKVLP